MKNSDSSKKCLGLKQSLKTWLFDCAYILVPGASENTVQRALNKFADRLID